MPEAQTHAASGAELPSPDGFEGPNDFALAVFEKNEQGGSISKERFIGLAHCCFQVAQEQGATPERDIRHMLKEFAGPFGDSEKAKDAANEIIGKLTSEVIPFVASEIFDVLDGDKNKGISKEEIDVAITAAMQGPSAAFGMLFKAVDKDGSGSLSAQELSNFSANIVKMAGKCALVFINVFAATFKDDMVDGAVHEIFDHLDRNEDGFLDKEELADMLGGLTMMKEQLGQIKEQMSMMGGPAAMVFEMLTSTVNQWKAAGDLNHDGFYHLFETLLNTQVDQLRTLAHDGEAIPVPPEIVAKFMPFVETGITALQEAFKINMKAVTDAYFNLMDANSDGIVQHHELMAVIGLVDADTTAEQCFDGLFAMVDSDKDGKISKDETVAFFKKLFDLAVVGAKNAVEVYQAIINAVAAEFFKFFIQQIAGGDDLSADKFEEIASAFAQDGPEVLLAPLMM